MADKPFSFDGAGGNSDNRASGSPEQSGQVGAGSGNADNGANGGEGGNNGSQGGASSPEVVAGPVTGKRGRKPLPRDGSGNIIRDGSATPNKSAKVGVVGKQVKNDRIKIRQQIAGMHMAVAVLTGQPVFALRDDEAEALTNSLCDVLDYHEIDVFAAGGHYGLYVTLAITAFGVYKPRIDILLSGDKVVGVVPRPMAAASPGEVKSPPPGNMNFGDPDL